MSQCYFYNYYVQWGPRSYHKESHNGTPVIMKSVDISGVM